MPHSSLAFINTGMKKPTTMWPKSFDAPDFQILFIKAYSSNALNALFTLMAVFWMLSALRRTQCLKWRLKVRGDGRMALTGGLVGIRGWALRLGWTKTVKLFIVTINWKHPDCPNSKQLNTMEYAFDWSYRQLLISWRLFPIMNYLGEESWNEN